MSVTIRCAEMPQNWFSLPTTPTTRAKTEYIFLGEWFEISNFAGKEDGLRNTIHTYPAEWRKQAHGKLTDELGWNRRRCCCRWHLPSFRWTAKRATTTARIMSPIYYSWLSSIPGSLSQLLARSHVPGETRRYAERERWLQMFQGCNVSHYSLSRQAPFCWTEKLCPGRNLFFGNCALVEESARR